MGKGEKIVKVELIMCLFVDRFWVQFLIPYMTSVLTTVSNSAEQNLLATSSTFSTVKSPPIPGPSAHLSTQKEKAM